MFTVSLGYTRVSPTQIAYFGYDSSDYSSSYYLADDSSALDPGYSEGQVLQNVCNGTTRLIFKFTGGAPYSFYDTEENSTFCGFTPVYCDLYVPNPPLTTDETGIANNDGTATIFATSSFGGITYYISDSVFNTTGYFTELIPGIYVVRIFDSHGCEQITGFTIHAFDAELTRYKYRLAFFSVKERIRYELKFLDQKHQYDPALYPIDLTGTGSPIIKKQTNSDEDKTAAFNPSSLEINILADGTTFQVSEFANAAERDWKIELYRNENSAYIAPATFAYSLSEELSPFIDGNLAIFQDGSLLVREVSSTSGILTIPAGSIYAVQAFCELASSATFPRLRMKLYKDTVLIYDNVTIAIPGAELNKSGVTQVGAAYVLQITTVDSNAPITPVNIADNNYPGNVLDWQGWLLPDELQDLYTDPKYPIQLTATDGLLSLKGSTFGDPSLTQTDPTGITRLTQLYGVKRWAYLVKICLDQLGYDYGETILLSSLTYYTYSSDAWALYHQTWADQFYDENGIAKDTYSCLEILLKGVHLTMFQNNGVFTLWDINDVYYRNNTLLAIQFDRSLIKFNAGFTVANLYSTKPQNATVGALQPNLPINPMQSLNYDRAFQQVEADIQFQSLALLFPNPSFELNSVQGTIPDGLGETANVNAFANYVPQDPLNPNIGAYAGSWMMRMIGRTFFRTTGTFPVVVPVVQAGTDILFCAQADGYRCVTNSFDIDQLNKKINISFVWRPTHYSDTENVCPRISIYFTDSISGNLYIYSLTAKGGFETNGVGTGWYRPDHDFALVPIAQRITDYNAWNSFSLTTDIFPESQIGTVGVWVGNPIVYHTYTDMTADRTIDYDAFVITQSDANDIYNFQTGEKHIVTNPTTYAKSEKKTVDLGLFSFPGNKRLAGNMLYGTSYIDSVITNQWFFRLSTEQVADRLPANIVRRIAKNYQRPMYKWQGDVFSDRINFYTLFSVVGLTGKLFIAFTTEMDLRNSTGNIVLIEIDDTAMQSTYQYVPVYERSARNNLS